MEESYIAKPISVFFDGSNYKLWAQEMSSFLRVMKLWRYVTGNISAPVKLKDETEDAFNDRFEEWDSKNHQIITWFLNTCSVSIKGIFLRFNTAKEVWELLEKLYSKTDVAHQYQQTDFAHQYQTFSAPVCAFVMEESDISKPISVFFDGSNYMLWAREMSSFLRGRRLWRYVTGNISAPVKLKNETEEAFYDRFEEWDSKNHQIITWFRNTCSVSITGIFLRFNTAKEVWELLEKLYSPTTAVHQYNLFSRLHQLKQEPGQSIYDLLSQMQAIWDQLAAFEPKWNNPDAAARFARYQERVKTMQFFLALRPEFETIRNSLLHRNPFPNFEDVVIELVIEEIRLMRRATDVVLGTSSTSHVKAKYKHHSNIGYEHNSNTGNALEKQPFCNYCKLTGHWKSECSRLRAKSQTSYQYGPHNFRTL